MHPIRRRAAAAATLLACTAATAQTTPVFDLTTGPSFANPYTVTITGPSTLVGDTNSSGVTWFGVLLIAPSVPFSMRDDNPDDGFSFTGLTAGTYALTFEGSGAGGYGGYYTVAAVPEPQIDAMLLAGLGALGLIASRRRRQQG